MLGFVGVTSIDTSVAAVTVSVVEPDILPELAVIVVVPATIDVANPCEPFALLMDAIDVADELQITDVVRFCVVLFENVPVAVNCLLVPLAMLGFVGVTASDTSVADVTVSVVEPDTLPELAVIVVVPAAIDVAKPVLLMVAIPVFEEAQVTVDVISPILLSENNPVAAICLLIPIAMLGFVGVTVIETSDTDGLPGTMEKLHTEDHPLLLP
jgi:hypothetical protein